MKFDDFVVEEDWDDADSSETAIRFDGFDEREEFMMVGVVVDTVLLIVCVEAFVRCHSCHHALHLRIV